MELISKERMLPFDLEKAKAGAKVCTADGHQARILTYDRKCLSGSSIVALVLLENSEEIARCYDLSGRNSLSSENNLVLVRSIRPYGNAEEFLQAQEEHGRFMTVEKEEYISATSVRDTCIIANSIDGSLKISYSDLLELGYFWKDGTPCGIEE